MFNIPLLNIMLDKHFFDENLHSYFVSFLYWNSYILILYHFFIGMRNVSFLYGQNPQKNQTDVLKLKNIIS